MAKKKKKKKKKKTSTKHTHKTKDRVKQTQLKTGVYSDAPEVYKSNIFFNRYIPNIK
jgi:hypothetical protein